ncbi:MAG: methyltransferase domain-containing protein [Cyclobacteriaceae bacterium]
MLPRRIKLFFNELLRNVSKDEEGDYWHRRAKKYGKRAVLNLDHSKNEIRRITKYQVEQIFPYLEVYKSDEVKTILDYGCGPGRFSTKLAKVFDAKVTAVDPVEHFLKLAPKHRLVEYKVLDVEKFYSSTKFDIIWICLVLGGLLDEELVEVSNLLETMAKKGTVLCLVENTSKVENAKHWSFRSFECYQKLFEKYNLKLENTYLDVNEEISVMIGKRN